MVDSFVEDLARPVDANGEHFELWFALAIFFGMAAGNVDFKCSHYVVDVVWVDSFCCLRVALFEELVECLCTVLFVVLGKFLTEVVLWRDGRNLVVFDYGVEVEAGSAAEDRGLLSSMNIVDGFDGESFVVGEGELFCWIQNVDHVVRDSLHLGWLDFVGADVEVFVYLTRVSRNNLTVDLLSESDAEGGFAGCCGPYNSDDGRFIGLFALDEELFCFFKKVHGSCGCGVQLKAYLLAFFLRC